MPMQDPARAGRMRTGLRAVLLACVAGLGIAAAVGGPIAYRELTTSAETVPPSLALHHSTLSGDSRVIPGVEARSHAWITA